MHRSHLLLGVGGACLAVLAGAWILAPRATVPKVENGATAAASAPAPAPVRGPQLACRLAPGDTLAFALSQQIAAEGQPAGGGEHFAAVMRWRVIDQPRPGEWLVGAAFTNAELAQHLTPVAMRVGEPLDAPFLLTINEECRFQGVGLPSRWALSARRFVASVVTGLELSLAPYRSGPTWMASQRDPLGAFVARYTLREGSSADGPEIDRTKLIYGDTRMGSVVGLAVEIVRSDTRARLDPTGHWVRSIQSDERLKLRSQGQLLADLTSHLQLARADDKEALPWPPPNFRPSDYRWDDPFAEEPAQAKAGLDPRLESLALADALTEFLAHGQSGVGHGFDAYAAALHLTEWLRARPDQAAALLVAMGSVTMPDHARSAAFLALERCGTPQARLVLASALRDHRQRPLDRARAASALSDVPAPDKDTVKALVSTARGAPRAGDLDGQMVSGVSLRALGHLGERLEQIDPTLRDVVRGELRQQLREARSSGRSVDVLDAIGNSGDEAFLDPLRRLHDDPSPAVREHTARALRRMDPTEARPLLVSWLQAEQDPGVRSAISDTLGSLAGGGREAAPSEIAVSAAQLAAGGTPVERESLIKLLGPSAATSQIARQALIDQFHRESVPALQRLLGRYLSVDDMRLGRGSHTPWLPLPRRASRTLIPRGGSAAALRLASSHSCFCLRCSVVAEPKTHRRALRPPCREALRATSQPEEARRRAAPGASRTPRTAALRAGRACQHRAERRDHPWLAPATAARPAWAGRAAGAWVPARCLFSALRSPSRSTKRVWVSPSSSHKAQAGSRCA